MIVLFNVVDTRTNKFHSIAKVSQKMVKYFIPFAEENDNDDNG